MHAAQLRGLSISTKVLNLIQCNPRSAEHGNPIPKCGTVPVSQSKVNLFTAQNMRGVSLAQRICSGLTSFIRNNIFVLYYIRLIRRSLSTRSVM